MRAMSSRKSVGILLVGIVLIGGFFRLYNHADWLHFELDQSRDAEIISAALQNGPGELPLQGPRAAGTFLRLGPGFYYLEYVSALIFGGTPSGIALFVALFSIAAIPMLFFFLRWYFHDVIALFLSGLFAVSPFFVLYGRFAWNPNPLPLLILIGAYALLKSVDSAEQRKGVWFCLSAFFFGLATHMHFLALIIIGVSVFIFLLYKRPRFAWHVWIIAIGIVVILYTPVFINEVMTGGKNAEQFTEAIFGKSVESKHNWTEKMIRNVQEHANHYQLMVFGDENVMTVYTSPKGRFMFDISCNDRCRNLLIKETFYAMIFVYSSILLIWRLFIEKDVRKKDFLVLITIWYGISFLLFLPITFDSAPRFFLAVCFVPFALLGLMVEGLLRIRSYGKWVTVIIAILVVFGSVLHTYRRFSQLYQSNFGPVKNAYNDAILREKGVTTLGNMQAVTDYMESKYRENGYPVYRYSESFYRRSFAYLLNIRNIYNDSIGTSEIYREGNYFLIFRIHSNTASRSEKYMKKYTVIEKQTFGSFIVWYCVPKPDMITAVRQEFSSVPGQFSAKNENSGQKRYIWSEVIGDEEESEE